MILKNIVFSIKESCTQVDETAKKMTQQGLCTYIHSNKGIRFFPGLFFNLILKYASIQQPVGNDNRIMWFEWTEILYHVYHYTYCTSNSLKPVVSLHLDSFNKQMMKQWLHFEVDEALVDFYSANFKPMLWC